MAVFLPSGKMVVSGSFDQTVRLWDVSNRGRAADVSGSSASREPGGGVLGRSARCDGKLGWNGALVAA
jgi:WD40 repeat protein